MSRLRDRGFDRRHGTETGLVVENAALTDVTEPITLWATFTAAPFTSSFTFCASGITSVALPFDALIALAPVTSASVTTFTSPDPADTAKLFSEPST